MAGNIYSVLQPSGRYKYYRGLRGVDEWGQSSVFPSVGLQGGVHFEQALPKLPLGSTEIGEGDQPQGTIARVEGTLGKVAFVAAIAVFAYLVTR